MHGMFSRTLFLLITINTTFLYAQSATVNYWNVLADITFETRRVEGYEIEFPKFGNKVNALHGKEISLKGYLIPLSESGSESKYMLSSLPFSSCFFCGSAGPETVIELVPNKKMKFSDNAIVVEGILILNDTDVDRYMYILKDAIVKK